MFQRRYNGSVDFDRTWAEYKNGFGDVAREHWLGNKAVHDMTTDGSYSLRIDLEDFVGSKHMLNIAHLNLNQRKTNIE